MFSFVSRFVFSDKSLFFFLLFLLALFAFSQLCLLLYFFVSAYSYFSDIKTEFGLSRWLKWMEKRPGVGRGLI